MGTTGTAALAQATGPLARTGSSPLVLLLAGSAMLLGGGIALRLRRRHG